MSTGNSNIPGPGPNRVAGDTWGWAWLWFWLFLIVILFAGWGWGGWYGGWGGPWGWWGLRQAAGPQATAPQAVNPPQTTARQGVNPSQANAAADPFLGRTVTVSGQVDQVFSPQAFTLAGSQGGQRLLVISKNHKTLTVRKGETVQITGIVEKYEAGELHKTTGADLSKIPAANFMGRPAVVASSVAAQSSHG